MEPTLHDMDDYNQPLSQEKVLNITAFFLTLIGIYMSVILFLET